MPRWRSPLADTLALVSFFTLTGTLNERYIAGMAWDAVAVARLIGAPLMVLTARPYGLWRDAVMRWAGRPAGWRATLWDSVALLVFQVPIYAAIIALGGAGGAELLRGLAGACVMFLVLGRPYGIWLDLVRRWFGLAPAAGTPRQRPMSRNS